LGAYCDSVGQDSRSVEEAITVCDLTGLGVEDLFIAEYCYETRKI